MELLAYWRWDNYIEDMKEESGFLFSSNQKRLHSEIDVGERLWIVTGRPDNAKTSYILIACLKVIHKAYNLPGFIYGKYLICAHHRESKYFSPDGPDASGLLLQLEFNPISHIQTKSKIGQSLQKIRCLSEKDTILLTNWSKNLEMDKRIHKD